MKRIFSIFTSLIVFLAISLEPAFAVETPSFPSCPNPGGSQIANYTSGIHGVLGQGSQTGSDSVFQVDGNRVVQCFCPESGGSGTQTSFWKLENVSQQDIDTLKNMGWSYVPNGSDWGLSSDPYVAKNSNFSCSGTGGGDVQGSSTNAPKCIKDTPEAPKVNSIKRSGSSATISWTPVAKATHYTIFYGLKPGEYIYSVLNTGNVSSFVINGLDVNKEYYFEVRAVNECAISNVYSNPVGGGQVLGFSTEFAATGTTLQIFILGSVALISGLLFLLVRHERQHA